MSGGAPFGLISEIDSADPATWEGRIFLTFDIDWANDEVIDDTIAIVERAKCAATWFVTHDTPSLSRLRANSLFELGIHPNFNFLLQGDPRNGATSEEVLDRLLTLVPEAKAVRSHSMTQNSVLLSLFADRGLTHDCNHFIPHEAGIPLKPWRHWDRLTKVPYLWEDDIACLTGWGSAIDEVVCRPGLRVFDFHPIHAFLNTETLGRYEDARPDFADPSRLLARRYQGNGVRSHLQALLSTAGAERSGGET